MHIGEPEELLTLDLFRVEKLQVEGRPFYRLAVPDWVNTVPVTAQGQVLLIRQFRVGIEGTTLGNPRWRSRCWRERHDDGRSART